MLSTLLLISAVTIQDTDVTVPADGVRRVQVEQFQGSVELRGWDRNEIRVQADHSRRTEVDIDHRGAVLSIEVDGRPHQAVDYVIDAPEDMDVVLEGLQLRVSVTGIQGAIDVETMQGPVTIENSGGSLDIETLAGRIVVDGFDGDVAAYSTGQRINIRRVRGDLEVATVGGPISLEDIVATGLDLESVGGPITFSGAFESGGDYRFSTHGGYVQLDLAADLDLNLEVESHSGAVDMDYPNVSLISSRNGESRFQIGNGGTVVEIETFSGQLRVRQRR